MSKYVAALALSVLPFVSAFAATPTISVQDSCTTGNATCTLDLGAENTDWEAGDVAIVHAVNHQTGSGSDTFSLTADNAYSSLISEEAHGGDADFQHASWYRVLTASDDNQITIEIPSGASGCVTAAISFVKGSTGTPRNATSQDSSYGTTVTAPSITTVADDLVTYFFARSNDDYSSMSGADTTLYSGAGYQTAACNDTGVAAGYETAASTSSGTASTSHSLSQYGMAFTVAWEGAATNPVLTLDDTNYTVGTDTIGASLGTAFSSAITTLTFSTGDTIAAESGATTSAASFIPELADLAPSGDLEHTDIETAYTATVTDGSETSQSDDITLDCPTGAFCGDLTCTPSTNCPGDSLAEQMSLGIAQGDTYLCRATSGTITTMNDDMVAELGSSTATIECRVFDESLGTPAWLAVVSKDFAVPETAYSCTNLVNAIARSLRQSLDCQ